MLVLTACAVTLQDWGLSYAAYALDFKQTLAGNFPTVIYLNYWA